MVRRIGRAPAARGRWASLVVVLWTGSPAMASAQEFHVDTQAENLVRFLSRASIEEFDGITERIDGYVLLNEPALAVDAHLDGTELFFEVDLASLDTGVGLRNRHMRDNYLEVKEHPYATFQGTLDNVAAGAGGAFRVVTSGAMTIHGVRRDMRIPCEVTPDDGGYRVRCGFQVLLSDFDIKIPRVMFLKLANDIRLELDFAVRPAPSR